MKRRIYIVGFLFFALAAALLTLQAQKTVAVVVATHNIRAGSMLQASDVEIKRVHSDSTTADAISGIDNAVGHYVSWPLTADEPVRANSLQTQHNSGTFINGLDIPSGYSAVALAVQPASAVGGMLTTGDHVDVYATPRDTQTHSTSDSLPSDATLLGNNLTVLQLRSDQGQALDASNVDTVHGLNFGGGKLGSIIVAVPTADVPKYASATSFDSIYVALSVN